MNDLTRLEQSAVKETVSKSRRQLLAGSAGALVAAGVGTWTTPAFAQAKPLPAYVSWKDANSVIVHSATTIETKRSAFGSSVITPAEQAERARAEDHGSGNRGDGAAMFG